jgi:predicted membrane protein
MVMDANDKPSWYLNIVGGLKRRGAWRMPRDMRVVSLVGGLNLDLTGAEIPAGATLTKISLVGGVSLRVPDDVEVQVEGFRLLGGVGVEETPSVKTRTIRVRNYGLVGGVDVKR